MRIKYETDLPTSQAFWNIDQAHMYKAYLEGKIQVMDENDNPSSFDLEFKSNGTVLVKKSQDRD